MHFCFCRCSFFISFNTTCGKTVVAIFDISTPEGGEGGGRTCVCNLGALNLWIQPGSMKKQKEGNKNKKMKISGSFVFSPFFLAKKHALFLLQFSAELDFGAFLGAKSNTTAAV